MDESSTDAAVAEDRLAYSAVHLRVTDPDRSLRFWRDAVGMQPLNTGETGIPMGASGRRLIVLHPGADGPSRADRARLFHVAVHLPDLAALATAMTRFSRAGVPIAAADHVFSKAIYATDPDGIGLEMTVETVEEYREGRVTAGGPVIIDTRGHTRRVTEPLDLAAVMAHAPGATSPDELPPGTRIGHVHLHVTDLETTSGFYRDVVGFEPHMHMPAIGMTDLRAGGAFPHRLALNTWIGTGAAHAPPNAAGLELVELTVPDGKALDGIRARAERSDALIQTRDDAIRIGDPMGNRLTVRTDEA